MSPSGTPEQIEAEMALQRERLVGTIDALTARLDVKSQAQAKAAEARQHASERVTAAKEQAQAMTGIARQQARTITTEAREHARVGVSQAKERATTADGKPRPELLAAGAAVLVAVAAMIWLTRR